MTPERIASIVDFPISAARPLELHLGQGAPRARSAPPGRSRRPRAMIPPRYSPSAETTSNVLAVPKSTHDDGPPKRVVRGYGIDEAAGAELAGIVEADRHPRLQAGADDEHLVAEVVLPRSGSHSGPSWGTVVEMTTRGDVSRSPGRGGRAGCAARPPARRPSTRAPWRSASARPASRRGRRRDGSGCCRRPPPGARRDYAAPRWRARLYVVHGSHPCATVAKAPGDEGRSLPHGRAALRRCTPRSSACASARAPCRRSG